MTKEDLTKLISNYKTKFETIDKIKDMINNSNIQHEFKDASISLYLDTGRFGEEKSLKLSKHFLNLFLETIENEEIRLEKELNKIEITKKEKQTLSK